jgi:hypothetical protein
MSSKSLIEWQKNWQTPAEVCWKLWFDYEQTDDTSWPGNVLWGDQTVTRPIHRMVLNDLTFSYRYFERR